ncbi:hypothetical protein [Lysinibacillus cavernae]|uniref:hypothetical protein n=1 Tax=Lysinibacillus cavernae TaxID=2666135 RepID=UPI0012D93F57|nr:hypothetical protein [Lysinibacillus cavernae]
MTSKRILIPIWIVLLVVFVFILFIYQMPLNAKPTLIFTAIYSFTSVMISLFIIGVTSNNKKLTNSISILAIIILFICSIGVAGYFNHHKYDHFQKKQILLTGASQAFKGLEKRQIRQVETGEYTKKEGFPFRYKVKITTTVTEEPYYFECSDYQCETMIRYTQPMDDLGE